MRPVTDGFKSPRLGSGARPSISWSWRRKIGLDRSQSAFDLISCRQADERASVSASKYWASMRSAGGGLAAALAAGAADRRSGGDGAEAARGRGRSTTLNRGGSHRGRDKKVIGKERGCAKNCA